MSIATLIYPVLSKEAAKGNIKNLIRIIQKSTVGIIVIIVPLTVGAIVHARPIIEILYGRGAFDENAITLTSNALVFYSIGMLGIGLREVFSRVFYAMEDTKTPVINTFFAVMLNVILNIILSIFMGLNGLAMAT